MKYLKFLVLLIVLGFASSHADVSINFYHDNGSGTLTGLMKNDPADRHSSFDDDRKWNNVISGSYVNFGAGVLKDHDNQNTTLTISTTAPNGINYDQAANNGGSGLPYDGTPMYSVMRAFLNPSPGAEPHVTISGLNENFSDGYQVLVYLGGASENTGASVSLTQSADPADWDVANDDTYWFKTRWTPAGYTTPVVATDTTSSVGANTTVADYALFDGGAQGYYDSDSFTITVDGISGGWAGIGGIEIIAIPEPATFGFITVASAGLLFLRKRFGMFS